MRIAPLLCLLLLFAALSMLVSVGCDDLTTEVNNNTYFDSTLGEDCLRCHADDDNLIKQPKGQWAESRHASPDLIEATVTLNTVERKTNVCGPQCHTSEGFIAFTKNGSTSTVQAPSVIDCFTCHMPHSGNYGSWQIDTLRGFTKPALLAGDFDYDMGKSNMCVVCHQADVVPTIPANSPTVPLDSLGEDGPHFSPQAHMLIGKGGFRFGDEAVVNSHQNVSAFDGCLSCHFGVGVGYEFGEHTFKIEDDQTSDQYLANCNVAGCHFGSTIRADFDNSVIQDSIRTLTRTLAGYLISAHVLTGADADSTEYFLDSTVSADEARILYNYLLVKKDGSRGVHNAKYARLLLSESVQQWSTIPRAAFTVIDDEGCAPFTVDFTNTSTGTITSYRWDFDTDNQDSATTRDASFTFLHPGSYEVALTVRASGGLETFKQTIHVDTLPSTSFTATDTTVTVNTPITLTQTSERNVRFLWDFGDGSVDSLTANPVISYSNPGSYTVILTVSNPCGEAADTLVVDVAAGKQRSQIIH